LSVLSAVAYSKPAVLRRLILTPEINEAGIYGFEFYIRGKPWVVDIDNMFMFDGQDLKYAKVHNDVIWPALFEKAMAKILGGYEKIENLS